jgi:hypothetical protein
MLDKLEFAAVVDIADVDFFTFFFADFAAVWMPFRVFRYFFDSFVLVVEKDFFA